MKRRKLTSSEARQLFDSAARATDQVYRGYSIRFNALANVWNISKDGFHIGATDTLTKAKAGVDAILGEPKKNPSKSPRSIEAMKRAAYGKGKPRKNPKPKTTRHICVQYRVGKQWVTLQDFPDTPNGKDLAIHYASKLSKAATRLKLRVIK